MTSAATKFSSGSKNKGQESKRTVLQRIQIQEDHQYQFEQATSRSTSYHNPITSNESDFSVSWKDGFLKTTHLELLGFNVFNKPIYGDDRLEMSWHTYKDIPNSTYRTLIDLACTEDELLDRSLRSAYTARSESDRLDVPDLPRPELRTQVLQSIDKLVQQLQPIPIRQYGSTGNQEPYQRTG